MDKTGLATVQHDMSESFFSRASFVSYVDIV